MGLRGWGLGDLTVDNSRCRWIRGPKFDFNSKFCVIHVNGESSASYFLNTDIET